MRGLLVDDFLVSGRPASDAAILEVVLHLVVVGEDPAAVGQGQQERSDPEGDDDGREGERLRKRIAEQGAVAPPDREAGVLAGRSP